MFELLTQTFNASVVAITQIFLSTVISTNPWFEQLDIQYLGVKKEIVCSTKLAESFTETLDDVLLSGKNITLHFRFELLTSDDPTTLQTREIVNGLRYDAEAQTFYLINSVDRKVERFFTIEEARSNYVTVRNLGVATTDDLSGDIDYILKVTAFLDPIKLDKMSESVNLMLRWASVKPTILSEKFRIAAKAT